MWKYEAPKKGETKTKEVKNKTYHYCTKSHGKEGKPMWTLHKECDHKGFTGSTHKTYSSNKRDPEVKLELKDDLRSLISVYKTDFA